jgi:hypothetical protein
LPKQGKLGDGSTQFIERSLKNRVRFAALQFFIAEKRGSRDPAAAPEAAGVVKANRPNKFH